MGLPERRSMPTENDPERQEYLDDRRLLIEAELTQSLTLDKALLTLSGTALGLSITFASNFVPDGEHQLAKWLVGAWCLFSAAIVCTVVSLFISQKALRHARGMLDLVYSKSDTLPSRNWWSTLTFLLNTFALLLFIVGVFSLAYLAWQGLPHGE